MNLLHVVPSYLPARRYGGTIYSVHGLCRALAARGHEVHVVTTNVDGPGDSDVPLGEPVPRDGVSVWYYPSPRLRRLYWSPAMRGGLRARVAAADVVHTHSIFLWPTWAAAREARRQGKPYVLSPRGMLERELVRKRSRLVKSAWLALIERRNLEGAAAVHFTSAREQEEARRFGYRLRREAVVPNGVDLAAADGDEEGDRALSAPVAAAIGAPGPYFLFLGRISWKKRIDRLIEALPAVAAAHLVVAGNDEEGEWPRLERHAEEVGVARKVTYVGEVHGADKEALFRGALALVLPSQSENFGNVVLEAMAAGCPVVVTPEVGAAEIVSREGAGIVVAGDSAVLGPALAAFVADEDGRRECGERGRAAAARYSWAAVAGEMEELYRSCVGIPRPGGERAG